MDEVPKILLTYGVLGITTLILGYVAKYLFGLLTVSWDQRLTEQKASQTALAANTEALKEMSRTMTQLAVALAAQTEVIKERKGL